jgi:hypothetical protein
MTTTFFSLRATRIFAGLIFAAALLCAQGIDGTLVGTVTDPTGAVVSNVLVTATNKDTGVKYGTSTDGAGGYRIDHLPVGIYDVTATATDFAPQTTANVSLQLNRTAVANLSLQLAAQSTSVQVIDAPAPLDTASAQQQTIFDSRSLTSAPAAATGTGFLNLSLLTGGVTSQGGLGQGTGPSIGGQRPTGNRYYIEGADNNSYFVTGPLGVVSNEAISEFSVLQNHFGSEFGGAVGGIFNAVVKSGGNQLHGSLYEYLQNRNLMALDALFAQEGVTSPPRYDSNRLGATLGGPILKNKLFYFGNFEYNPVGYAFSPGSDVWAPTAAGFQTLAGLSGLSKTNLDVLQHYAPPAPAAQDNVQVLGTDIPIGPLSIVAPSYANSYHAVGSADWNISDRDKVRGRYIYSRFTGIDTNSVMLPEFFATVPVNTHLISLSEYHSFSPDTLNELRLAYSRNNSRRTVGDISFPGLDSFPTLYFADVGLLLGPNPNFPSGQIQGVLQASDTLTKTVGRHTIKAGYDFRDIILSTSFVSYPRGYYGYASLEQYLLDLTPDYWGLRTVSASGPVVDGWPTGFLQNAAFVQDDFRVRPNLTFNLGLRYEYVTVPVMSRAQQYSAIADVPGVLTFREPQPGKNDWAPSVGFAYSPGKSGVWAIRGGFSRSFDMPYTNLTANTPPAFYGVSLGADVGSNAPDFLKNGGLTGAPGLPTTPEAARAGISNYIPDQLRPYALNYTLSVQRLLGKDYTLEARYLGSRGVHLIVQQQINRTSPVTAAQHIPTFLTMPSAADLAALTLTTGDLKAIQTNSLAAYGFTNPSSITAYEPQGNSQYHGLSLQLTKRYSKNFSYLAAYTWSHLMDDSTATANTTALTPRRPQDFQNLRAEWADSILDRRHRFTLTPIFNFTPFANRGWAMKNLVGNWNFSFTYTYESPEYATVQSGAVDSNLNKDTATDRTIINPGGIPGSGTGVTGYDRNGNAVAAGSNAIVAYVANNPNAQYIVAGVGALANAGRNTMAFDPINNIDASLRKVFNVTESKRFEIGAQFYNLFNHSQFVPGYVSDISPLKSLNRNFLIPSSTDFGRYQRYFSSNPRYIQLLAKFTF